MNKNNLIIIPTAFEAAFISVYEQVYFKTLLQSGIGKKSIETVKLATKDNNFSSIILLGFAGSLSNVIKTGSAFAINTSYFKDEIIKLKVLENLKLETATVITVKKPIHSEYRKKSFKNADLVDMETFFLASYAKENNFNFYSIRVALDDCTNDLINIFKGLSPVPEHIKQAGKVLNMVYQELVNSSKSN